MIFKLLKSYNTSNLLLIILLTVVFLLGFFADSYNGLSVQNGAFSLYSLVYDFFAEINKPLLNKIIITILILFEALFLTVINNYYNLLGKRTYLPMLIYILVVLNILNTIEISAIIFANILFLAAWLNVKKAAGKEHAIANYYNASILIGIASLFYPNYIFLVVILWFNLLIIRKGGIRELIFSILGVLTVWYFVFSYYYLSDKEIIPITQLFHFEFSFHDFINLKPSQIITRIYISIIFIFAVLHILKYFISLKIDIRNNLKLLFILFVVGLVLVVSTNASLEIVHLTAIPVSLFISYFLVSIKKAFISNILLAGLLLLTIFNLYFGYLIN